MQCKVCFDGSYKIILPTRQRQIIHELAIESKVFDHIPGRYHNTLKSICPHITSHIDVDKLTKKIEHTKETISKSHELKNVFTKAYQT